MTAPASTSSPVATPSSSVSAVPVRGYGVVMGLATAAALGVAWGTAMYVVEGTPIAASGSASALLAVKALAVGSFATLAPIVLQIGHDTWGLAVLLSGAARAVIALAFALVVSQMSAPGTIEPRPLFMGICAGTVFLLIIETAASVAVLSRIEKARAARAGDSSSRVVQTSASPAAAH